jgi:hypothetical protein
MSPPACLVSLPKRKKKEMDKSKKRTGIESLRTQQRIVMLDRSKNWNQLESKHTEKRYIKS